MSPDKRLMMCNGCFFRRLSRLALYIRAFPGSLLWPHLSGIGASRPEYTRITGTAVFHL